jgi:hypothetical protein
VRLNIPENTTKHMKTILTLILMASTLTLPAQSTVQFQYDDAGNRTERNIIVLEPESTPNDSTLKTGELSDLPQLPKQTASTAITQTIGQTVVQIYPNPTGGKFTVEIEAAGEESAGGLQLLSLSGEKIIDLKNPGRRTEVDLTGRPAGAYILYISISGKTHTWKVIKQ